MNILHITASPRGSESLSKQLGKAIASKLSDNHPGGILHEHDLSQTPYPHLEEVHLSSFYSVPESRTAAQAEAVRHSDDAIDELFKADTIIISTPMYNFGIPSALKAWIDHIARAGKTFSYSASGAEGLLKNKKVFLAIATGAVFSEEPYQPMDFTENYLKALLGFLGITDVTTFRVEGVAIPDLKEAALSNALHKVATYKF